MYRFEPLLKQTLWGGDKIIPFKHLDVQMEDIGESWEISGVKGSETIVAEGKHKGKSLNELVSELKDQLVGQENYKRFGDEFPLLIKFIDAQKDSHNLILFTGESGLLYTLSGDIKPLGVIHGRFNLSELEDTKPVESNLMDIESGGKTYQILKLE